MIWNQWAGAQGYWPGIATQTLTVDGVPYRFYKNGAELMFFRPRPGPGRWTFWRHSDGSCTRVRVVIGRPDAAGVWRRDCLDQRIGDIPPDCPHI